MKNKPVFIFDLDGTLIDSKKAISLSFQQAFLLNGLPKAKEEDIVKYMGLPLRTVFEYLTKESKVTINQLILSYRLAYNENMRLVDSFPGIDKMLETLSKKGKIVIATSKKTESAIKNLVTTNLMPYITGVLGEDMVEQKKPHPESINILLRQLNCKASNAVMIGDSLFDIQMGHAANVKTIGVTWGATNREDMEKANPTFIADTVDDILALL